MKQFCNEEHWLISPLYKCGAIYHCLSWMWTWNSLIYDEIKHKTVAYMYNIKPLTSFDLKDNLSKLFIVHLVWLNTEILIISISRRALIHGLCLKSWFHLWFTGWWSKLVGGEILERDAILNTNPEKHHRPILKGGVDTIPDSRLPQSWQSQASSQYFSLYSSPRPTILVMVMFKKIAGSGGLS